MKVKSTKKNILFITISILTVLVIFTTIGLVLYFKFNPQKKQQTVYDYTLTINSNGGSDGSVTEFTAQDFSTHSFTLPEMWSDSLPTRLNFELIGFADTSDATAPQYKLGENVVLTSNYPEKTIYAVWRKPLLISGNEFNEIIKEYNIENIIFGNYQQYENEVRNFKKVFTADTNNTGAYNLYTVASTIYVLSKVGYDIYSNSDCSFMFKDCNISYYDFNNFVISDCTNMSGMFSGCSSLTSVDLSKLNTANCTDLSGMFSGCSKLTSIDLTNFSTDNCVNLSNMFKDCLSMKSIEISNLNTEKCSDMSGMFSGCSALTELNLNFDTSSVTDMSNMFSGCSSIKSIIVSDNFNTANVTNSSNMFLNCTNLSGSAGTTYDSSYLDKTYARIDGGRSKQGYFSILALKMGSQMNSLIGSDTTKVVFGKLSDYSQDVVSAVPTSVDTLDKNLYTFYKVGTIAYILTESDNTIVANPDSSNFFRNLNSLTAIENLTMFDTSKVTTMTYIFYSCPSLTTLDLRSFDTSSVENMNSMFNKCSSLSSLDLSSFDTSSVKNMNSMFNQCSSLISLNLRSFDTSSVENMNSMFNQCSSLTSLDLSSFDTSSVNSLTWMFYNCSSLTSINLSNFDTSKVTNMSYMFCNCTSLTTLDLSSFNTSQVNLIYSMFSLCRNLVTIYVSSSFNTAKATISSEMFNLCTNLVGGEGTTYNSSYTDKTYARIDGGASSPGYFTLKE